MRMIDRNLEHEFRDNMEHALDEHFPKYKCKERSGGLMLYAKAILEHETVMCLVRKHLGYLLSGDRVRNAKDFESAVHFYQAITKTRDE